MKILLNRYTMTYFQVPMCLKVGQNALSTDIHPFLNRLYHSFIIVLPIISSPKAFSNILIVSTELFFFKQNLMHIRWSHVSVIFSDDKIRRTQKATVHNCKGARILTRVGWLLCQPKHS